MTERINESPLPSRCGHAAPTLVQKLLSPLFMTCQAWNPRIATVLRRGWIVHLAEQSVEEVVRRLAVVQTVPNDGGDRACWKKVNILGKHRDNELKCEALGILARKPR